MKIRVGRGCKGFLAILCLNPIVLYSEKIIFVNYYPGTIENLKTFLTTKICSQFFFMACLGDNYYPVTISEVLKNRISTSVGHSISIFHSIR